MIANWFLGLLLVFLPSDSVPQEINCDLAHTYLYSGPIASTNCLMTNPDQHRTYSVGAGFGLGSPKDNGFLADVVIISESEVSEFTLAFFKMMYEYDSLNLQYGKATVSAGGGVRYDLGERNEQRIIWGLDPSFEHYFIGDLGHALRASVFITLKGGGFLKIPLSYFYDFTYSFNILGQTQPMHVFDSPRTSDWRVLGKIGFRYSLSKRVSFVNQFSLSYDNHPHWVSSRDGEATLRPLDYRTRTSLDINLYRKKDRHEPRNRNR